MFFPGSETFSNALQLLEAFCLTSKPLSVLASSRSTFTTHTFQNDLGAAGTLLSDCPCPCSLCPALRGIRHPLSAIHCSICSIEFWSHPQEPTQAHLSWDNLLMLNDSPVWTAHFCLSLFIGSCFIEIQFTYHIIHPFKAYKSMVFKIFIGLCNYHHSHF